MSNNPRWKCTCCWGKWLIIIFVLEFSSNEWNGEECAGVVFYYALVFRRCHFSYYCYFTSRWVSCFCFICFLLVVSRIPARFLYFCRDCWCFFSNVISALMKWLWYLKATATFAPFVLSCLFAVLGLWNFESGYTVETVWWKQAWDWALLCGLRGCWPAERFSFSKCLIVFFK
jgi:hypothetical protein